MRLEVETAGPEGTASTLLFPLGSMRARPGLNPSVDPSTLGPCPTAPDTLRAGRQNSRAHRARGAVALLGGLCAERRLS